MDDHFNTQTIAQLFDVSTQTIKNWSDEFGDFLSPMATPGRGRRRIFSEEDIKIFALLHEYHKQKRTYEDARVALAAGQRGDMPDTSLTQITVSSTAVLKLRDQIMALQQDILDLQQQLKSTESELDKERGRAEATETLLSRQLAEKERQIRELLEENARLKAREDNP